MGEYDVELRQRTIEIKVKSIIEYDENGPADFPRLTFLDENNKRHIVTALDFSSFEWEKLKEGSILLIRVKEQIQRVEIIEEKREGKLNGKR